MMRDYENRQHRTHMTRRAARSTVQRLLAGCTDTALAGMTVETLTGSYNIDRKAAEYELQMARRRRAHRG